MKDPVVQEGDAVLRTKAAPVAKEEIGSKALKAIISSMKKTLAGEEFGVAIAAPQIGVPLRIFVVAGKSFIADKDTEESEEKEDKETPPDMVFINPVLKRLSRKKKEMSEGCLSVRGVYGTVLRHEKASVEALDENGTPFTYHGSGLIAHIFQHECDHLDGILFIDKAVSLQEEETVETH